MQRRLGRHYRLRWSAATGRWQIEHKVGRVRDYPGTDDKTIRLRDGYHLVLDTPVRDYALCPKCSSKLPLTPYERQEIRCSTCAARGNRAHVIDGYFPLTEGTLQYLEHYHPRRGDLLRREMAEQNLQVERSKWRSAELTAEAIAAEDWRRVFGIPRVGYTKVGTPHSFGA